MNECTTHTELLKHICSWIDHICELFSVLLLSVSLSFHLPTHRYQWVLQVAGSAVAGHYIKIVDLNSILSQNTIDIYRTRFRDLFPLYQAVPLLKYHHRAARTAEGRQRDTTTKFTPQKNWIFLHSIFS